MGATVSPSSTRGPCIYLEAQRCWGVSTPGAGQGITRNPQSRAVSQEGVPVYGAKVTDLYRSNVIQR